MRSLTVEAKTLQSARLLYSALSRFHPELVGDEQSGYQLRVELGSSDRQVVDLLNALEDHVNERQTGPAQLELEGRRYTMHPA